MKRNKRKSKVAKKVSTREDKWNWLDKIISEILGETKKMSNA